MPTNFPEAREVNVEEILKEGVPEINTEQEFNNANPDAVISKLDGGDYVINGKEEEIARNSSGDILIDLFNSSEIENGDLVEIASGLRLSLSQDLHYSKDLMFFSRGEATIDLNSNDLLIQGSANGNTSDLSSDASRGDKTITVVDGSKFSAGEWIQILGSPDQDDNDVLMPQTELNKIKSISTDTLTLKYPLAHNYPTGFTTEPNVTVVDNLRENIVLRNLNIQDGYIRPRYIKNLQIENVNLNGARFLQGNDTSNFIAKVDNLNISDQSGSSLMLKLCGLRFSKIDVDIEGPNGGDAIRLRGCADSKIRSKKLQEIPVRALRMYQCDNVEADINQIQGTQTATGNIEVILFNYSDNCTVRLNEYEEKNKTGEANAVEFRGDSTNCNLDIEKMYIDTNSAIMVKADAYDSVIDINKVINRSGGGVVVLVGDDPDKADLTIEINKHEITKVTSSPILLRTSSTTEFVSDFGTIKVKNCVYERGEGNLVSLGGTNSGNVIQTLDISNVKTKNESVTEGSLITVNIPCDVINISNARMDSPGSRAILLPTNYNELYLDSIKTGRIFGLDFGTIKQMNGVELTYEESTFADIGSEGWFGTNFGNATGETCLSRYDGEFYKISGVAQKTDGTALAVGDTVLNFDPPFKGSTKQTQKWTVKAGTGLAVLKVPPGAPTTVVVDYVEDTSTTNPEINLDSPLLKSYHG